MEPKSGKSTTEFWFAVAVFLVGTGLELASVLVTNEMALTIIGASLQALALAGYTAGRISLKLASAKTSETSSSESDEG